MASKGADSCHVIPGERNNFVVLIDMELVFQRAELNEKTLGKNEQELVTLFDTSIQ